MGNGKLTIKQEKFCLEYVRCGNGAEAAKVAGYKGNDKVLKSVACENLTKPYLVARIEVLKNEMAQKAIANAEERRKFLSRVLRGEVMEETLDSDGRRREMPPKIIDRLKAIDLLNKMDGEYLQKVEVQGALPVVIIDDVEEMDDEET